MTDLPTWANTLIIAAVSTIVTSIVGFIIERALKRHFDQRERILSENEQYKHDMRREERKREIGEIVSNAITPINERLDEVDKKIDKIQEDLKLDREGTVVQMRVTMMDLHKKYTKQGYADTHEKATWDELYNRYKQLGGNHFAEYIDRYKSDIEKLPDAKKTKSQKK